MNLPAQWPDEVIRFWFEEIKPQAWFERNAQVDASIQQRFAGLHDAVSRAPLEDLIADPRTALAAVIVLDQFPRNLFRNSPRAFATDAMALAISRQAIERSWDQRLSNEQRLFLYMPFQHAEDRNVQARSLELFAALGDAQSLDYARQHQAIIDRFGRFPHRNVALGRSSTPEEIEFMKTHPGF
jgi:uncharacterized protein (DUF924 family)